VKRIIACILSVGILCLGTALPARADTFTLDFTTHDSPPSDSNGDITITTDSGSGGVYNILSISGTRAGQSVTLLPAGNYSVGDSDNLLYFPAANQSSSCGYACGSAYFDNYGFNYTAGGNSYAFWYDGSYEEDNSLGGNDYVTLDSFTHNSSSAPAPIPGVGLLSYLIAMFSAGVYWRKMLVHRARTAWARLWARIMDRFGQAPTIRPS
jgi:hypothetical protein